MGLDGVELIMEVEDQFGIHIKDEDATRVLTVGDLYELITRQVNELYGECKCPAQRMFYLFRQTVTKQCSWHSSSIRPSTHLNILFPKNTRSANWRKLRNETHFNLPQLSRPIWITSLGWISCFAFIVLLYTFYPSFLIRGPLLSGLVFYAPLVLGIIMLVIFFICTRAFKINFPGNCQTLGDLIRELSPKRIEWRKEDKSQQIWESIVEIICDQLGVKKQEVQYDTNFVRDLNLD